MFSKTIPLTSQEAFEILCTTDYLKKISKIIFNFQQLFNVERSTLLSHHKFNPKISNNREFLQDLEARYDRLNQAIENNEPYPFLYGDVCLLKEYLQVILGYYQDQLKAHQPVANSYLKRITKSHKFSTLMSDISEEEHPELGKKDSEILIKYTINFCAKKIMMEDLKTISDLVIKPFLFDHKDEKGFSYCNP
ncbi:TPA: lpg1124 family Dot/Icm T4SS effector [Legionella pneumophila]|nr:lpg1124 family Dot/Icm T4SS effector [Legionella pneumophila]